MRKFNSENLDFMINSSVKIIFPAYENKFKSLKNHFQQLFNGLDPYGSIVSWVIYPESCLRSKLAALLDLPIKVP